jgi:hypothetical protein
VEENIMVKKFIVWYVVIVVFVGVFWDLPMYLRMKSQINQLATENALLRTDIERRKAAMFKQGIWYYRTTVLGQCLPQE